MMGVYLFVTFKPKNEVSLLALRSAQCEPFGSMYPTHASCDGVPTQTSETNYRT